MENNSQENALEIKSLTKFFGNKVAVDHLTFNVPAGSITGFIGPNGAGKTTTLRILATLLKANSGIIKIFGQVLRDSHEIRRKIGFMPDNFGLYEDMEVEEYLDFFAAAYHISLSERKKLVPDLLNLLDLTVKKNSLVIELSRGMQQRLSLARSLVHNPKLLLLDEPASGLDPRARIELMGLLRELRNMGKTIFISSHILAELRELCDFVVIIERGKLVYHGTVGEAAASISGQNIKLRIVVAEKATEITQELQNFNGIVKVSMQGANTVIAEYETQKTDSAKIVKFLIDKGFLVQEIIKEMAGLEDVFMTLTQGGVA